ncbi:hypothetical protein [Tolypothrix sp. NIES-4075]|nr:hypothetical protein [Tolypothrix sp. NIES-4075]
MFSKSVGLYVRSAWNAAAIAARERRFYPGHGALGIEPKLL